MVEAKSFKTTAAACQKVMKVKATVVATTTLVVVVDEGTGRLVCIGENYVMSLALQSFRETFLASRPPPSASANHDYGLRLQYPADCVGKVPAKMYLDAGFDWLAACKEPELLLGERYGDLR
jgi:hypothetical protein